MVINLGLGYKERGLLGLLVVAVTVARVVVALVVTVALVTLLLES